MVDNLITGNLGLGNGCISCYPCEEFHANDDSRIGVNKEADTPYIRFTKDIPFGDLHQKTDKEAETKNEGKHTKSTYNHNKSNPHGWLGVCGYL